MPDIWPVKSPSVRQIHIAVVVACVYLFLFGLAEALFQIRPFWNDEWRLIYNIKFKSFAGLWGRLDLLQECPRTYLTIIKAISNAFDYSYTSLRLPPLMLMVANLFFVFHLRRLLYPKATALSYLFILILVSSQTFTDYMVQVKQYEMDILLTLLSLWQLFVLLRISRGEVVKGTYAVLCLTALLVPYLSYIYPIVMAPVFPVVALALWARRKEGDARNRLFRAAAPLALATVSILVLYWIDIRHVLGNKDMYDSFQRAYYHSHKESFVESVWKLFALVGSGELFEVVFGVLGISAFGYALFRLLKARLRHYTVLQYFHLYAVLLLLVVMFLFLTGKLATGAARLTAYTVPSIALLIIALLQDLQKKVGRFTWGGVLSTVLFLALFGNILTTCINTFTYVEYPDYIRAFHKTGEALRQARREGIPIMVSDGINGRFYNDHPPAPGTIATNTIDEAQRRGSENLAAEVLLKIHPEYKLWDPVPYFYMPDNAWIPAYVRQVPPPYKAVIAGDGQIFRKYILRN